MNVLKIDLTKLKEIWNPFESVIWYNVFMYNPITKEEIFLAIHNNDIISPEEATNIISEQSRVEHIKRVAWLVINYNESYPIDIDFGFPPYNRFVVEDGNHRLAAAIYLNKEYVYAKTSGLVEIINSYLY